MNRRLFWKLSSIIAIGVVSLFYFIDLASSKAEEEMSMIHPNHKKELKNWSKQAEALFNERDLQKLDQWLKQLQKQEQTWVSVATSQVMHIAGDELEASMVQGNHFGRSIDWKIHLYFQRNPTMELPFSERQASLLIRLPDRMRPGTYWQAVRIALQILIPMLLLFALCYVLYQHIMSPLKRLEQATKAFSSGNWDVRVTEKLGKRNDELAELTSTFDAMATKIGELIRSQRQLIADLSHELRTPLTRLDIAVACCLQSKTNPDQLERIERESKQIRKLVDDTLTLAWLDNEQPEVKREDVELTDLLDVLVRDARFEFPDRKLECDLPQSALLKNSNHRALGHAIENILRNAMRYTPANKTINISLKKQGNYCIVEILDQGPGVKEELIDAIFKPFFRAEEERPNTHKSFGLGLALAKRHLALIGAKVTAKNSNNDGLLMSIIIPETAP